MDSMNSILLGVIGLSAGMSVSGGVFTTLLAIGLVPRFAGKTHTADHIFLYEEMVVFGTIAGGTVSIFFPFFTPAEWVKVAEPIQILYPYISTVFLGIYGLFAGIFVGCLALAIAEMLDTIPIFARRIRFRHGIGIVILGMAIGKTAGSLIYFVKEFF